MHLAGGRQLLRDLKAGVATADDEHAALRNGLRRAIARAVHLHDVVAEILGDPRHEWRLERAGGDHHLPRLVGTVIDLHDVTVVLPTHRADAAVQLNRKIELAHIVGEVIRHLVPHRITIRIPRKLHAGQRVVARGCEELQRVPALAPRRRRLFGGLEDPEICALLGEE
jgi:hypothetical protein